MQGMGAAYNTGVRGGLMAASKESRETDPFSVRALVRGLSILGLFDVDHREWTIDEMAEQTGLLRMTAYRMVRTLESMAFLVRDASANRYRLGPAALALTYIGEDNSELVQAARPFLDKLTKETGESVTLAVDIDGFPVCVDIINTSRPFKRRTAPGRILGDLVSVHGKLFAAYKSPEDREALLAEPHPQHTPYSVVDTDALRTEFEQIAHEGVAYDVEGVYLGTCAVGAPVRDQVGNIAATVSVVVPTGRFGPAERQLCTVAVKSACAAFSAYLGWDQSKTG